MNNQDSLATNDELARRLFQREARGRAQSGYGQPAPGALASRREPGYIPQTWPLGKPLDSALDPVSERERRALFAALSKGTKANLGRETTVAELVHLVEAVDRARALVRSSQEAIEGRLNVYIDGEKTSFSGSMQNQESLRTPESKGVA